MTDQFCYLCIAVAGPGIVAQGHLILQILLQVLRHLKWEVADQIVVGSEVFVELQSDQLGVDAGELVVGEDEAGDVLVVLGVWGEAREGREVVVREVEHGGPGWYCWEVSQALARSDWSPLYQGAASPGGCS